MNEHTEGEYVHPTTDKTWRYTTYDLSAMPLEAARIFYRTRLELRSADGETEPWQVAVEVLRAWVAGKEARRRSNGLACLVDVLPSKDGLMSSPFVRGGCRGTCPDSYLCTAATFAAQEDLLPRHWALEYVERDGGYGYRFWVTEVGISAIDMGVWVMNVRVRSYVDPTYVYEDVEPQRNAPRFVRDLILSRGVRIASGGVSLRTSATVLTQDNFDRFLELLIDPGRTAPLVVVSRHERDGGEPTYPVDPLKLARLLMGVAAVYALDRNDPQLERSYAYVFDRPEKPAYKYRLVPGCLRIFWGGVDLDEPSEYDYARHRFFTSRALEELGEKEIVQNIAAGVSRMFSLRAGEVLSIRSVAYQASLLRMERIEQTRASLAEQLRDAEAWRSTLEHELEDAESSAGSIGALRQENELLNELLSTADEEIDELKVQLAHTHSGVSEDDYFLQLQSLDHAERAAAEASERADALERENGHLRYRVDQLEDEVCAQSARAESNETRSELLFEAGSGLRDSTQAVGIAARAFADRLVILDEAVASAEDYRGDAGELFDGLAALYRYLWPLRFGEQGRVTIDEDRFKAQSGFEITFNESKQTNKDARLVRLRQRVYRGKTCDITAHIKGGNRKRGYLRIHFFFDDERRLIVVGHCGDHLETYGTQRL